MAALGVRFPTMGQAVEQSKGDLGATGALYPNRHTVTATIGDEEQTWDVITFAAVVGSDGLKTLLFREAEATDGDRGRQYVRYVLVRTRPDGTPFACGVFICPPQLDSPESAMLGVLNAEST